MCCAQYGRLLHFLNRLDAELNPICHLLALLGAHHILHVSRIWVNFVPSRYAAQVLSECFPNGSICPCYYWYHFCFHIPHSPCSIVITILLLLLLLLYDMDVSCHRPFLPGTSLEPAVIPTAQASSFTLQYFPYYA